jgi:RIO-like serine/threonine protein kinase
MTNYQHCLVMEFIDAPSLDKVWTSISGDERQNILSQLQDFLNQLRQLVPPHPGCVETADGSPCFDTRQQSSPFGPFPSVAAFHTFLGHDYVRNNDRYLEYRDIFDTCARRSYRTTFTHGDLAPRNILVRDGKIVGIIDWEFSGWYSTPNIGSMHV